MGLCLVCKEPSGHDCRKCGQSVHFQCAAAHREDCKQVPTVSEKSKKAVTGKAKSEKRKKMTSVKAFDDAFMTREGISRADRDAFEVWLRENGYQYRPSKKPGCSLTLNIKIPGETPTNVVKKFLDEHNKNRQLANTPVLASIGQGLWAVASETDGLLGMQTGGAGPCVAVGITNVNARLYAIAHIDPKAIVEETVREIFDEIMNRMPPTAPDGRAGALETFKNNTQILVSTSYDQNEIVDKVRDALGQWCTSLPPTQGSGEVSIKEFNMSGREADEDFLQIYARNANDLGKIPRVMLRQMLDTGQKTVELLRRQVGDQEYADVNEPLMHEAVEKIATFLETPEPMLQEIKAATTSTGSSGR